jgi:hypothetical protein
VLKLGTVLAVDRARDGELAARASMVKPMTIEAAM